MRHIKELTIKGFRGLHGVEMQNFGSINLFVGGNNSGKTSILEAIELMKHPHNMAHYIRVSRIREIAGSGIRSRLPLLDSLEWIFPANGIDESPKNENNKRGDIAIESVVGGEDISLVIQWEEQKVFISNLIDSNIEDKNNAIENLVKELIDEVEEVADEEVKMVNITSTLSIGAETEIKKYSLTIYSDIFKSGEESYPIFKTQFVSPVEHRVSLSATRAINDAVISGDRPKIIDALKLFDENIMGIEILSPDSKLSIPYINHRVLGLAPISIFGDGLKKALILASAVVRAENGVLLIDELETAVHTNALTNLFTWLIKACEEFDVQLFATTHSLEAIDAVLDVNSENLGELVIYRIGNNRGKSYVKRFSGATSYNLRNQLGQDVR